MLAGRNEETKGSPLGPLCAQDSQVVWHP
jgi:hypothetical protein